MRRRRRRRLDGRSVEGFVLVVTEKEHSSRRCHFDFALFLCISSYIKLGFLNWIGYGYGYGYGYGCLNL